MTKKTKQQEIDNKAHKEIEDNRSEGLFQLVSDFKPMGDQPQAINTLTNGVLKGKRAQVLLGVTGSGKTYTIANVIKNTNKPTLVLAHNKTLAAQLFSEFKSFFPNNAVEYFVSYYDYYQPEAYLPASDTYIEKDAQINEEIDKLRHRATTSLLQRKDVIIVASVSCIYGLGSPEDYNSMRLTVKIGNKIKRKDLLLKLVEIQYQRNDIDFHRGTFRAKGDVIDVFPANEDCYAFRIELFGDDVDTISKIDTLTGKKVDKLNTLTLYPGSHYVTQTFKRKLAIESIRKELSVRLNDLKKISKEFEAKRLEQRTLYDLEMFEEIGFCKGIENYSRHLTGREAGEAPPTLIEYFPDDFLLVIDESHVTVPQVGAMYKGDRSRKSNLVEHGFRLPSALDNRPLKFEEFEKFMNSVIFVSATPANYELELSKGEIVEQLIRPTGLLDPEIVVKKAEGQVTDLEAEVRKRIKNKERVLVTTLTKKFAEDLTSYLASKEIKVKYLHSDIETLERIEIIKGLRKGEFDVLVGINLLREGLDIPEVSLVAILDADKEGFLRSERSLIQTIGRAARNSNGSVILYGDKITESMKKAITETNRRREAQEKYNIAHGITPKTILKEIRDGVLPDSQSQNFEKDLEQKLIKAKVKNSDELENKISKLEKEMKEYASKLEFEKAAKIRDELLALKELYLKS